MDTANKFALVLGIVMILLGCYQFSNGDAFGAYVSSFSTGAALAGTSYFEIIKTDKEQCFSQRLVPCY